MKNCPFCGKLMPDEAKICGYCGASLTSLNASDPNGKTVAVFNSAEYGAQSAQSFPDEKTQFIGQTSAYGQGSQGYYQPEETPTEYFGVAGQQIPNGQTQYSAADVYVAEKEAPEKSRSKKGFILAVAIAVLVVILAVGAVLYFTFSSEGTKKGRSSASENTAENGDAPGSDNGKSGRDETAFPREKDNDGTEEGIEAETEKDTEEERPDTKVEETELSEADKKLKELTGRLSGSWHGAYRVNHSDYSELIFPTLTFGSDGTFEYGEIGYWNMDADYGNAPFSDEKWWVIPSGYSGFSGTYTISDVRQDGSLVIDVVGRYDVAPENEFESFTYILIFNSDGSAGIKKSNETAVIAYLKNFTGDLKALCKSLRVNYENERLTSVFVPTTPSFISDLSAYEQYMNPQGNMRDAFLIVVNKKHPVSSTYVPPSLEYVPQQYCAYSGEYQAQMQPYAARALTAMLTEAANYGITDVKSTLSYRSYTVENYLFNQYVEEELKAHPDWSRARAEQEVETYKSRPGYGEHMTGLATDIHNVYDTSKGMTLEDFGNSETFKWLKENCWKFGYIFRFDRGKENITGYNFESCHFRYVGRYHAEQIYKSGLTLEEYVEQNGYGYGH